MGSMSFSVISIEDALARYEIQYEHQQNFDLHILGRFAWFIVWPMLCRVDFNTEKNHTKAQILYTEPGEK